MTLDRLEYKKMRPMYDSTIHRFLKSQFVNFNENDVETTNKYKEVFHNWIQSSKFNTIKGLDNFNHLDIIHGVTHLIDDLHCVATNKLVILPNEYPYHKRISDTIRVLDYKEWKEGDIAIISSPFAIAEMNIETLKA